METYLIFKNILASQGLAKETERPHEVHRASAIFEDKFLLKY
jgi:hypothetical protein